MSARRAHPVIALWTAAVAAAAAGCAHQALPASTPEQGPSTAGPVVSWPAGAEAEARAGTSTIALEAVPPEARAAQPGPGAPEVITLDDQPFYERRDARMGTVVDVVIPTTDQGAADAAAAEALAEIARIEALMTDWNEVSQLAQINHAAGREPVRVDRELLELLETSKRLAVLTGGAFDVTYASVGKYWDFHALPPHLPDPAVIRRALPKIDSRKLILDHQRGTAFLAEEGMRIGLGGIAKGYAVERAAEIIRRHGFEDFAIRAGGDMRVVGRWKGKPWKVGIRDPRDREGLVAVVPVSNVAVSTSGDYERYFELDGKRYAHIIDPRTGYPVSRTQSVTVIAHDCTLSDGLSKSVFVLGAEKGLALIESLPGVQAVVIDESGQLHLTQGLAKP